MSPTDAVSTEARFEYRVFAPDLGATHELLRARFRLDAHDGAGTSLDTYLLGPRRDRSVKVRDGAIDIKALRDRDGALERWEPVARHSFPLERRWVETELAAQLGVARIGTAHDPVSLDHLLRDVVPDRAELRAEAVAKRRERFARAALRAEHVDLAFRGARSQSVAVESSAAAAVCAAVDELALGRWPNRSYVAFLRAAGDAPAQTESPAHTGPE